MSVAVQTGYKMDITLNDKTRVVYLNQVPRISLKSLMVFHEFGTKVPMSILNPISDKISSLKTTKEKLEHAKKTDVQNKILAFVHAAFLTAIAALGIIGAYFAAAISTPFSAGIGIAAAFIYFTLTHLVLERKGVEVKNSLALIATYLTAPFLPIFEAFGRTKGIELELFKQEKAIEENIYALSTFFSKDHTLLHQQIKRKIEGLEKSYTIIHDQLPVAIPTALKKVTQLRENYSKALEELTYGMKFFHP